MKLNTIDISMLDDYMIGNAEDRAKATGCTVIISEKGATGGVDARGGSPATKNTDILKSENSVDKINAVVLSGGSFLGLEAASGVTRELSKYGIGYKYGNSAVPLVCGASLFDLQLGDPKAFPDVEMGIEATQNAFNGRFRTGNSGAGTGASVGKTMGMSRAMKSGLGTFACGDGSLEVGAVVAVNASGDVYNGAGNIIAGLRTQDGKGIYGTIRSLKGMVHKDLPKRSRDEVLSRNTQEIIGSMSRVEHKARMKEVARAIKEEFRRTNQYKKSDILEADKLYKEEKVREEQLKREEQLRREELLREEKLRAEQLKREREAEIAAAAAAETEAKDRFIEPETPAEPEKEAEIREEAAVTAETQSFIDNRPEGKHMRHDEPETADDADDDFDEVDEFLSEFEEEAADDGDLGYDIPFNTTIGCLVTNAKLTKAQANKLASILQDAYARAVKPVHSTRDGDIIFVLASGKQEVDFDAFAALATDVMQYAVIDAAMSAKSAYGLPAAGDLAIRR